MMHGGSSWVVQATGLVLVSSGRHGVPSLGLAELPRLWPKFTLTVSALSALFGLSYFGQRPAEAEIRPRAGRSLASSHSLVGRKKTKRWLAAVPHVWRTAIRRRCVRERRLHPCQG